MCKTWFKLFIQISSSLDKNYSKKIYTKNCRQQSVSEYDGTSNTRKNLMGEDLIVPLVIFIDKFNCALMFHT